MPHPWDAWNVGARNWDCNCPCPCTLSMPTQCEYVVWGSRNNAKVRMSRLTIFFVTLKELEDSTELCDDCLDSRLVIRISSRVANQSLCKKLLPINPPPQLPDLLHLCCSEELAQKTKTKLDNTGKAIKRILTRRHQHQSNWCSRQMGDSKCGGCDDEPHTQGCQK